MKELDEKGCLLFKKNVSFQKKTSLTRKGGVEFEQAEFFIEELYIAYIKANRKKTF